MTVLFSDLVDSTPLGERLDPESLRRVMARYFDEVREALENHGAVVEKFIGDAVMAVFGIPNLHEDDALRAVRAAFELQQRVEALNAELERRWNVRLETRTGLNTGEVVAGDAGFGQALVTGDAVNLAKRLEQAAGANQVLIGSATRRLVAHAVEAEALPPLTLKGKTKPVHAWRLTRVLEDAQALPRRLSSPLVGRRSELAELERAFERAVRERRCIVCTVVGPAGIGKSRLVRELCERVTDHATAVTGRCLPYGEGITFWPLVQIVRELGGEEGLVASLEGAEDADLIAERVRATVGLADPSGGSEEGFWGIRSWLEALARKQPLLLCVEDIQWAERKLLDLVEYVAGWSRDAPILIICLARPELYEAHPAWTASHDRRLVLPLDPLSEGEAEALLANLAGGERVGASKREQIVAAAEGNPLFVEQMVAMAGESGSELAVPPSIQALLTARLDQLDAPERVVLECASVVGREFWRGSVAALVPAEVSDAVGTQLMALVRKGLVRPERSSFPREDAFGFLHALIRDAAYEGLPKERRADLHERVAGWLRATAGARAGELEEIVGYHYEQAYRYLEQLAPLDERSARLAAQAGEALGSAGRRAFARDDMAAALKLLDRAMALITEQSPTRLELLRELGSAAWAVGELARAETLLTSLIEAAGATGDRRIEWYALLEQAGRKTMTDPSVGLDELVKVSEEAVRVFEELGDELGLARAWRRLATAAEVRGHFAIAAQGTERALTHARAAGDRQEEARSLDRLCTALLYGPTGSEDAIARCEVLLEHARQNPMMEASVSSSLAGLAAMRAQFDRARQLARRAGSIYEDLGLRLPHGGLLWIAGDIELLAGNAVAAERELRRGYEFLAGIGVQAGLAAQLARALYLQGRYDEAWAFTEIREEKRMTTLSRVAWLGIRARLEARAGRRGEALECARKGVELAETTDAANTRADALLDLAAVLELGGQQRDESAEAIRRAAEIYEAKGNLPSLRTARALLRDRVA